VIKMKTCRYWNAENDYCDKCDQCFIAINCRECFKDCLEMRQEKVRTCPDLDQYWNQQKSEKSLRRKKNFVKIGKTRGKKHGKINLERHN
jgi:hypothetical protein